MDNPAHTTTQPSKLPIWIIVLMLILSVGVSVARLGREQKSETRLYRKTAIRYLSGEQVYRPDDRPAAFPYPPFCIMLYLPESQLPQPADRICWAAINIGLLLGFMYLTWKMAATGIPGGKLSTPIHLALIWLLALAIRLTIIPLEYESHDYWIAMLSVSAIYFWQRDRNIAAGIFAAVAAAIKATPLLFVPFFLVQRRWTAVATAVVVLTTLTFLPDLFVANPDGPTWASTWQQRFISKVDVGGAPSAEGAWSSWNVANQSLSGTLYRYFQAPPKPPTDTTGDAAADQNGERPFLETVADKKSIDIRFATLAPKTIGRIGVVLKLAIFGWVMFVAWPRTSVDRSPDRTYRSLAIGSTVLCAMLLLSPMSSGYHFDLLLPPLCVMVVDALYRRRSLAMKIVLIAMTVLVGLAGRDIVGSTAQDILLAYGNLTWAAIVCLISCGRIALADFPPETSAPETNTEQPPAL